jgi:threonine synthase
MQVSASGPGLLERYGQHLPITSNTPALTLHEGATPLLEADRLARWIGVDELYLKVEGANPTGSFKDRGMVVAVAKAIEEGARLILCASTGNTAASCAAYAARAGIESVVLLPSGKVALGKLAQAVAYGARVLMVDANFDGALDVARELCREYAAVLVNSVNPHRIAGQATAAYEICDQLGDAPDVLVLPVGNGGNITAYARGFERYQQLALLTRMPRIIGAQAAGAAPFVQRAPVADPQTVASAIRIGRPATWEAALDAADSTGGCFHAVSDEEILYAYRQVARLEGVFCEPASAAALAALRLSVQRGNVPSYVRCVCVLTGHGLKDPATAMPEELELVPMTADAATIAQHLGIEPNRAA